MRTLTRKIGGKEFTLTADFAASYRIAEEVGDPLLIAREASLEDHFLSQGIPYSPKWKFTISNTVLLLRIATGADKEEMEELVFKEGFVQAKEIAVDYLTSIIGPMPEADVGEGDKSGGKPVGSNS